MKVVENNRNRDQARRCISHMCEVNGDNYNVERHVRETVLHRAMSLFTLYLINELSRLKSAFLVKIMTGAIYTKITITVKEMRR